MGTVRHTRPVEGRQKQPQLPPQGTGGRLGGAEVRGPGRCQEEAALCCGGLGGHGWHEVTAVKGDT